MKTRSIPLYRTLRMSPLQIQPYRNGQTRNSQNQPQTNLPPPPPPPTQQAAHSPSPVSDLSHNSKHATANTQPATQSFTPMAYNPAAPAAPEPIAPREDTPPPDDGAGGTGLAAAARHDLPYTPGPYTAAPGPMSNPYGHPGSPQVASAYGVPPQSAPAYQQQYHSSITSPATSVAPSFAGPPLSTTNTNLSSTNATSLSTGPSPGRHPSVAEQHYTLLNIPTLQVFNQQKHLAPNSTPLITPRFPTSDHNTQITSPPGLQRPWACAQCSTRPATATSATTRIPTSIPATTRSPDGGLLELRIRPVRPSGTAAETERGAYAAVSANGARASTQFWPQAE